MKGERGAGDLFAAQQLAVVFAHDACPVAEDMFKYSCLNPGMGATIRSLSKLAPHTLALMHGPSGDGPLPCVPWRMITTAFPVRRCQTTGIYDRVLPYRQAVHHTEIQPSISFDA
jgi:hypothetical protein